MKLMMVLELEVFWFLGSLLCKRWMWKWTLLDGTLLLRHLLGVGHLRLRHRLRLCDRVVVGGVLLGSTKILVVLVLVLVVLVRLLLDPVLFPDSCPDALPLVLLLLVLV